jgi:hypothetical protein
MKGNRIKWIKSRCNYSKMNTYMTAESVGGFYYMTTNDTPNRQWNLFYFTDSNDVSIEAFFNTLSEIKKEINERNKK